MGLQLENLVLSNMTLILEELGIPGEIVVNDGPYLQHTTKRHPGCQIDTLIQTKLNELYIVEIKFHKGELGLGLIDEVKEKRARLSMPKNFSTRFALVHVNGIKQSLEDADFFTKIVDLSKAMG